MRCPNGDCILCSVAKLCSRKEGMGNRSGKAAERARTNRNSQSKEQGTSRVTEITPKEAEDIGE